MERQLARRPKIDIPTIVLYGADDGIARPGPNASPQEQATFTALMARRVIEGAGHFMPREKPGVVASAMLEVLTATK
jgi:pimeloyl-ACP methyl ester carboxylesterase